MLRRHGAGDTSWNFTGLIDDIRIYNRTLTPQEIQTLANPATQPQPCHLSTPSSTIPTGFGSPYV
jgi:hypothetical protein